MAENMYVWKVGIKKAGADEVFDNLYFVAGNFFQLSHFVAGYVYGDERSDPFYKDFPVEVVSMVKIEGIGKIVNAADILMDDEEDEVYDPEQPLDTSKFSSDHLMTFKCVCHESITCADYSWPYIKCPECDRFILRKDITEIPGTGVFAYTPSNGKGLTL